MAPYFLFYYEQTEEIILQELTILEKLLYYLITYNKFIFVI